ncbi:T9SS type A sorting domain-containing protein [Paracrocinitomix mangrovi]|uniref:T9SS type A sorting domain-containing protein n=1 Tax=Paracrocinitomix mangrovi TaxID=2862509 RepID=UPI001C8F01B3|nr:T9SS type A sorting domain-containing protein [Paracrocinitomix mangrovi]UKN02100.1 T9SS type A sorting domain-containing protein [Paracrocinitomix mangrovi]
MKFSILFAIIVLTYPTSYGQEYYESTTLYQHMLQVNNEWKFHKDACNEEIISFKSEEERIAKHLELVIIDLQNTVHHEISPDAFEKRQALLNQLKKYANAKEFPQNTQHSERRPYFIDYKGVHCAVGYLMQQSGHENLALKISKDYNFDYIEDIQSEGMLNWAESHGFEVKELKWIQPGYPPNTVTMPVGGGANNEVKILKSDTYRNQMVIAGEFTELDSLPCLKIGVYKNDQLSCLGGGLSGIIYDVEVKSDGIYCFGAFNHNNEVYPMAFYNDTTWAFDSIPGVTEATITSAVTSTTFQYLLHVSVVSSLNPGKSELWNLDFNEGWIKMAEVNGTVLDMAYNLDNGFIYGGLFDSVYVYTNGQLDSSFYAKNAVHNVYYQQWKAVGENLSDTIYTIESYGNSIYLAGASSNINNDAIYLSQYLNGNLLPLLQYNNSGLSYNSQILDLAFLQDELYFAGSFDLYAGVVQGNNLGVYNLSFDSASPYSMLDDHVNAVCVFNNQLYIGGAFVLGGFNTQLNHLAKVSSWVGIDEELEEEISVFPNPFNDKLKLSQSFNEASYKIFNSSAQLVKSGVIENNEINNLSDLEKGAYIMHIQEEDKTYTLRVIKE